MTPNEIHEKAVAAAKAAFYAAKPTPMVVGEADGLSNRFKPGGKQYYVADGVCGFAWVNIKPARGKFVTYLKKSRIGRTDSYYGGYTVSMSGTLLGEFTQSYERLMAAAGAYAKALNDNGITAYADGRLD